MTDIDAYITARAMETAAEPLTDYMAEGDTYEAAGNVLAAGAPLVLAEYLDAIASHGGDTVSTGYLRELAAAWRADATSSGLPV